MFYTFSQRDDLTKLHAESQEDEEDEAEYQFENLEDPVQDND